jgi:hypothetical protein
MAGPSMDGLAFFLDTCIADPGIPEQALFLKLENPHLTFPETVQG